MLKKIYPLLLLVSILPFGLWAGKEFPAGNEAVVPNQLLVRLRAGADINQVLASVAPQASKVLLNTHWNTYRLQLPPGLQAQVSHALANSSDVEYVEPNRLRSVNIGWPNDPNAPSQWALTTIQALQAWNYLPDQYLTAATAGTGRVKVAVLDTGADCTHPDFKNDGGSSTDSAQGGQLLWASSKAPVPTSIASPACAWQDDHGHGTHTAGTIAASTQNATGVASIAYPVQLLIYKILDASGSGSDDVIAQAIADATDAGAAVISMSLGGAGYSQTLQNAIDYAWQHNALVVAAAGNTSNNQLVYPGAANHALGVGATASNNTPASFSTYGNWVKIAAPGVNILSTAPTYPNSLKILNYAYLSGTSMATPHVAGVAGLLALGNPNLSVAAIAQRLQRSAQSPNAGWDQHIGYGIVNAAAAISANLRPTTLGSLVGQVVDNNNLPIAGALVSANGQSFTTATDGLFRIANLTAGSYTITVSAATLPVLTMQAAVVAGADTMMTIPMGVSLGEFTGTVTNPGMPVEGAIVEARSGGVIRGSAVTDTNGAYALYLRAGTYDLSVSAPGNVNNTVTAQVLAAGAVVTVNFAISRLGNIVGVVKDSSSAPVAGAHINIAGPAFTGGTNSDASGNFATGGLVSGTYTLTVSAPGYTTITTSGVAVSANLSTTVTLQFSGTLGVPAGLSGYWSLDEGSGTTALDTSGSGFNAAIAGATWTTGEKNSALSFDGTTSYAVTAAMPMGNAFSISVWTNPSVALQRVYARIVETRFNAGFYLGADSAGTKYKFIVANGAGATGTCGASSGCAQGGTIATGWHMVTATYDGAIAKLYVDTALVATETFTQPGTTNFPLYIGRYYAGAGYNWNGALDEIRLYNRAVTASEVGAIYSAASSPDTTPPSTPVNVTATASSQTQVNITWSASTDNVGVVRYQVFRNGTLAGTTPALSFTDTGLTASTNYSYTVVALDAAGNASNPSAPALATTMALDTTPPAVVVTAPAANSTVSGTITVSANASDNVAVRGVQFQLDGVNIGAELASAPYSLSWNTTTASNGSHTLTAVATDTSNNATTSLAISVTVSNTLPVLGLNGYWNFDEGSGSIAHDTSGGGYNATINGATWTAGRKNSGLFFNGSTTSAVTSAIPIGNAFSVSIWVNPSVTTQRRFARIAETRYDTGFYLGTDSTGTTYKFIVKGGVGATGNCGANFGCAQGGTVASGWHLVTATFDGATAKLYVDSALVATETFTQPGNTNYPLYIGQYYAGAGYNWNGALDEIRLYTRALTAAEVANIYAGS